MKTYTITVNGVAYHVTVEEGTTNVASTPALVAPVVPVAAPVAAPAVAPVVAAATQTSSLKGSKTVEAPMPGKIISVSAKIGQVVKKGDVLLVLEAMKMENEITATEDGTIASIEVSAGNSVNPGQVLVTLD